MVPDDLCIRKKNYIPLLVKYSGTIHVHFLPFYSSQYDVFRKISVPGSENFRDDETQATVETAAAKLYVYDTEFDCQSRLVNSNFSKTRSCTLTTARATSRRNSSIIKEVPRGRVYTHAKMSRIR